MEIIKPPNNLSPEAFILVFCQNYTLIDMQDLNKRNDTDNFFFRYSIMDISTKQILFIMSTSKFY